MTAYQLSALGILIGSAVGIVAGELVWRITRSRPRSVWIGLAAGAIAVIVAWWLYYTIRLCPPDAGCV